MRAEAHQNTQPFSCELWNTSKGAAPVQATFTNATTLALNGLTGSAQSYAAGAKTGIYPIQNFTDGSATGQYVDSNGAFYLGCPFSAGDATAMHHPSTPRSNAIARQHTYRGYYFCETCLGPAYG